MIHLVPKHRSPLGLLFFSRLAKRRYHAFDDAEAPAPAAASHASILIVDDDPGISGLLRMFLRRAFEVHVEVAADGREAIERLGRRKFDLVISDVQMPGMGGVEFFHWIEKNHPELAGHFLFMTGYDAESREGAKTAACGAPVLTKPFDLGTLAGVCEERLMASH